MMFRIMCRYILVVFVMLLMVSCYPVDDDGVAFQMRANNRMNHGSGKIKPLKAGDKFDLQMVIDVVRPVRNVKFMLVIPKEVEIEKYFINTLVDINSPLPSIGEGPFKTAEHNITLWEGDLAPSKKQRERKEATSKNITVFLMTKTDGVKWSEPIKGWIEFDYEREGKPGLAGIQRIESGHYREDFTWTHENWVSGNK